MKVELIGNTSKNELEERIKMVASAGKLSRTPGTVFDVLDKSNDYSKNLNMIKRIIGMGHKSIIEHDYLVFAISDVSPIVEQTLIGSRLASFTIKSRREVDFSNVGYYIPSFDYLENGEEIRKKYIDHMNYLFDEYSKLIDMGIKKEDARFILPYCYHSNIIMGMDARSFEKLTKSLLNGKLSKIPELKELGLKFKEIAHDYIPYLNFDDPVEQINDPLESIDIGVNNDYEIIDKPRIISHTPNIDDTILTSIIMNRYQVTEDRAQAILDELVRENPNIKEELMKMLYESPEKRELEQVNFRIQIPISLAVLTHLTRHRMHSLLIPDFVPIWDLTNYKTPDSIKGLCEEEYKEIYARNLEVYEELKAAGVKEEDLVYFYLSGNMCNVTTNMNGSALQWISQMRCCNKAQWEIRNIMQSIVNDVKKIAPIFGSILGPTCEVEQECYEGRESCGKVKALQLRKDNQKF